LEVIPTILTLAENFYCPSVSWTFRFQF